jgi:hypothetical protein
MNKINSISLVAFFLCAGASQAQTLGYVAGGSEPGGPQSGSLSSFNPDISQVVRGRRI